MKQVLRKDNPDMIIKIIAIDHTLRPFMTDYVRMLVYFKYDELVYELPIYDNINIHMLSKLWLLLSDDVAMLLNHNDNVFGKVIKQILNKGCTTYMIFFEGMETDAIKVVSAKEST